MRFTSSGWGYSALLVLACLPLSTCWAQGSRDLTARELFYTPLKQAPAPVGAQAAKPAQSKAPGSRKSPAQAPAASRPAGELTGAAAAAASSAVPLAPAAYQRPLGLRYSFLRYDEHDAALEVNADAVFRNGDRMRIRLQANDDAYLYMVMQGTSGAWRVMFPTPEYDGGDNRVRAGVNYDLPRSRRLVFTGAPGTERIFLVLTRAPIKDLEELIYGLHKGTIPKTPPAGSPQSETPKSLLAAVRPVDDSIIGRLRNALYARDLVFEKVDEATPGETKEAAVYVVNRNPSPDARLVVDITLKHE